MLRIGFVGTENSHVKHFIRFLNVEERHPGFRAAALVNGDPAHNAELAEYGGIDTIVDSPEELIGKVDMAIVCNRDGALHREVAEPLLRTGMPVLVDKPMAASTEDALALIDAGHTDGARLFSASALRFVPEMPEVLEGTAKHGAIRHVHVVGPADPECEHSGLFFYGIHPVEAALEILGNPVVEPGSLDVDVARIGGTVVARFVIDDVFVTISFVTAVEAGQVPFHATVVHETGVVASELSIVPDYNAPALDAFLHQTKPLTDEQMLSPVAIMESIVRSL